MSGGRGSAKARSDEGKQLTGWSACGNDVRYRLNYLRDNVDDSRGGKQGDGWHDRMNCCRFRRRRLSTHYHCAIAAGFAEGRFRLAAGSLERLPITTVRRGNTATGAERRAALPPFTVPCTRRFGKQHGKKQHECSQYSDEASFRHGRSIPLWKPRLSRCFDLDRKIPSFPNWLDSG